MNQVWSTIAELQVFASFGTARHQIDIFSYSMALILIGGSAAVLPRRLSYFKAIGQFVDKIAELRDFTKY